MPKTREELRQIAIEMLSYTRGTSREAQNDLDFGAHGDALRYTETMTQAIKFGYGVNYATRPSAPAALVDGVMLARGERLSQLLLPGDAPELKAQQAERRAQAAAWVNDQMKSPEGLGLVLATAVKGFNNIDMAAEIQYMTGAEDDTARREALKTDEGRLKLNCMLNAYMQSSRELSQITVSMTGTEFSALDRDNIRRANANAALPHLFANLSDDDLVNRVRSSAIFNSLGRSQIKPRRVAEFYTSEDYAPFTVTEGEAEFKPVSYGGDELNRKQQLATDMLLIDEMTEHILVGAAQGKKLGETPIPSQQYYTELDTRISRSIKSMTVQQLTDIAKGTVTHDGLLPSEQERTTMARKYAVEFISSQAAQFDYLSPEKRDETRRALLPETMRDEAQLDAIKQQEINNPPAIKKSSAQLSPQERESEITRLTQLTEKNRTEFAELIAQKGVYINGKPAEEGQPAIAPLAADDPIMLANEQRLMTIAQSQYRANNRLESIRQLEKQPVTAKPTTAQLKTGIAQRLAEARQTAASRQANDPVTAEQYSRYIAYLEGLNNEAGNGAKSLGAVNSRAVFSPQLNKALIDYKTTASAVNDGAHRFLHETDLPEVGYYDHRELGSMSVNSPDETPEMKEYIGRALTRDIAFSTPQARKEALDGFYDISDSVDPLKLDLSCVSGTDIGPRGTDGLTDSERDFKKLAQLYIANQNFGNFYKNDADYINQRYPDPVEKAKAEMKIECVTSMNNYLSSGVNTNNGYGNSFKPDEQIIGGGVFQYTGLSVDFAKQRYAVALASIEGKSVPPLTIKFDHSQYESRMDDASAVTGKLTDVVLSRRPLSAGALDTASSVFMQSIEQVYMTNTAGTYLSDNELKPLDMITIDGVSASDAALQKYPDNSFPGKNAAQIRAEREKLIKADILRGMALGEAKIEAAMIVPDAQGNTCLKMTELHGDSMALKDEMKKRDNSWLRRAFDWGPFKIKTEADKAEEIWKNDTEKQTRQSTALSAIQAKASAALAARAAQAQQVRENARQILSRDNEATREEEPLTAEKVELNVDETVKQAETATRVKDDSFVEDLKPKAKPVREHQLTTTIDNVEKNKSKDAPGI